MRVLVTTTGSAGHFGPLIPFAEALRDRGADVLVATRASRADAVRAQGWQVWPCADAAAEPRDRIFAAARELPNDEANLLIATEAFARLDTRAALPGMLAAVEAFRPQLVLQEAGEFAGALAAEHAGLALATVAITLGSTEQPMLEPVRAVLAELRAEHGLRRDAAAPTRYLTLTPPALEDAHAPGALRFRERDAAAPAPLPDHWGGDRAPLVYVTFGSVAPQMPHFPDLCRAAIDALAPLPARLLVTVGRDRHPADLGPLPANIHVERWIPQADVLPHAAAMVCHGGFGTVRGGLAAGVPIAVLPLFADQPSNAARVAAVGAGVALEQGPGGVAGLPTAVRMLLQDPAYATRAAAIAADARALPTVDAAAAMLEELAQPVAAGHR